MSEDNPRPGPMNENRLSEGGDEAVLANTARAKKKLPARSKQFPAIALFIAITLVLAAYKFFAT